MAQAALQAPQTSARLRRLAAVGLLALSTSGCLTRSPETTGSLGDSAGTPAAGESWRTQSETWGRRFDANPGDVAAAINYARALRGLDQHAQALAVLQQAAIRNPKHFGLLGAYGKALADVGRLKEAADVLSRAHLPERPDWRILSAQGAVADQMNDACARAAVLRGRAPDRAERAERAVEPRTVLCPWRNASATPNAC